MTETHLVFPQLAPLYLTLAPLAAAGLRVVVGLWMVPHGLRMAFGFFPSTFPGAGLSQRNIRTLAVDLDQWGYHPGWLWAPLIAATELIAGPMLAIGLFTRVAAVPLVLFLIVTNFERWRVGRYFWNKLGMEYTLMWLVATFYFLVHGGGAYSLDHLLGWEF
jgi:putative oxidoreductase